MKTLKTLLFALVVLAAAMPAAAQPARLYDNEVKSLLEQSKKTVDRFWDTMDSALKNTTFKGPSGEFVVKKIVEDYKNTIDVAGKRIAASYSASTEVGNIFKEGLRIHNYVNQQGPGMKGASEWQAHAAVLGQLAREYDCAFPPAGEQTCRRYTDKEVVDATGAIEQSSKQIASALENALKKDKATPETARKALLADVKLMGDSAKSLASYVKDKKPASAQVTTLFNQAKKVQGAVGASSAANAVTGQLGGINAPLSTIGAAFHVK
jgi:hypothetical protein